MSNHDDAIACSNQNDLEYLGLVERVLRRGSVRSDRTGTGTISRFGESLTFNLRDNVLPLLTCKWVNYRAVLAELLWFISGSTDSRVLEAQRVDIWKPHATRENLDKIGLTHLEAGQLGPIYGHQWRHLAYDQIEYVLRLLREEPTSRRILINSWNVADIEQMALPPCHVTFQLYVEADNSLSGLLYVRSSDVGLGLPFNIASYGTLLHLLAAETDRTAASLHVSIGDAHIYTDHIEQMESLLRKPIHAPPKLSINLRHGTHDLAEYRAEDFTLHDYKHNGRLPMRMSL